MVSRFGSVALGVVMLVCACAQGYAFMMESDSTPTESDFDLVQMVEDLQAEMKDDAVECEDMLAKLDIAIEEIDLVLDNGVKDEESYLVARDALVDMRLELPCLGEQLAQNSCGCAPAPTGILGGGGGLLSGGSGGGILGGGGVVGSGGGGILGGGGGGLIGGGGGGLIGGSPLRLLAIGGAAIGIAVGAGGGDDDNPGPPATVMAN